jgi:hypothetical protein
MTRAGQQASRRCRSRDRAGARSRPRISSQLDDQQQLQTGCRARPPLPVEPTDQKPATSSRFHRARLAGRRCAPCSAGKAATQQERSAQRRTGVGQTRSPRPRPSGARNRASRDTRAGWQSCRIAATRWRWSPVGADCSTHLAPADWSGEAHASNLDCASSFAHAVDLVTLAVSGWPGKRKSAPANSGGPARAYRWRG